jgi:hypothetical protein
MRPHNSRPLLPPLLLALVVGAVPQAHQTQHTALEVVLVLLQTPLRQRQQRGLLCHWLHNRWWPSSSLWHPL